MLSAGLRAFCYRRGMTFSALFNPARWRAVEGFKFKDLTFHRAVDQGTVRIAFNRPEVRNAFRPRTVDELTSASSRGVITKTVSTEGSRSPFTFRMVCS